MSRPRIVSETLFLWEVDFTSSTPASTQTVTALFPMRSMSFGYPPDEKDQGEPHTPKLPLKGSADLRSSLARKCMLGSSLSRKSSPLLMKAWNGVRYTPPKYPIQAEVNGVGDPPLSRPFHCKKVAKKMQIIR